MTGPWCGGEIVHAGRVLGLTFALGCGAGQDAASAPPPEIPQLVNVVRFYQTGGTGVYLGGRTVLTVGHQCAPFGFETTGSGARSPRSPGLFFNAPEQGDLYCEGLCATACLMPTSVTANGITFGPDDAERCSPVTHEIDDLSFFRAGIQGKEEGAWRIVFIARELDLCIIELSEGLAAELAAVSPLALAHGPVDVGQEVIVAGHPAPGKELVVEACKVVETVKIWRDPDQAVPSDLEVPSFKVDCRQGENGSSGSPVFDRASGRLLGLLWTGERTARGKPTAALISAVSHWQGTLDAREPAHASRLRDVLNPQP